MPHFIFQNGKHLLKHEKMRVQVKIETAIFLMGHMSTCMTLQNAYVPHTVWVQHFQQLYSVGTIILVFWVSGNQTKINKPHTLPSQKLENMQQTERGQMKQNSKGQMNTMQLHVKCWLRQFHTSPPETEETSNNLNGQMTDMLAIKSLHQLKHQNCNVLKKRH